MPAAISLHFLHVDQGNCVLVKDGAVIRLQWSKLTACSEPPTVLCRVSFAGHLVRCYFAVLAPCVNTYLAPYHPIKPHRGHITSVRLSVVQLRNGTPKPMLHDP